MIEHQIVHGPFPMKTAPTTPPKLTALWVLDTLGALGFAYGLAGAVASFPHPGSALPGFVAVAVLGGSARAARLFSGFGPRANKSARFGAPSFCGLCPLKA